MVPLIGTRPRNPRVCLVVHSTRCRLLDIAVCRRPALHVRDPDVHCGGACPSLQDCRTTSGPNSAHSSWGACSRSSPMFPTGETFWHGWDASSTYFGSLRICKCPPGSLTEQFTLQATLEIEFMHQTLGRYVTPAAAKSFADLYNWISKAYARRAGEENLQANLDGVKKILAETRRATAIEFLCFRQNKTLPSPSSRSGPSGGRPRDKEISHSART